ncbi:MAG TPA: group II intron reverse transcriptase/maturase [Nitrospirota bacterium]|nr:group II intron reverse transcriptase/maturase [Nitrospirota bacterium]
MDGRQRKIQLEMAFTTTIRGEAPKTVGEGTEPSTVKSATERPATERLMEEVCERENLNKALRKVRSNQGSPGIDGMTVDKLRDHLIDHWPAIRKQLIAGKYKPSAVKRVTIPKPDGGERKLGIPTALDRFIQQAVLQVLQPIWDSAFSDQSYGFRPGRSAHQAVAKAQEYIGQGKAVVVDLDLEKFFDRVNHDILMSRIARKVTDKRLLKLIRAYLAAGVMENGLVSPTDEGTPQGGPLSPLLSNIMLDDLDKELDRRGHSFVRYADDCNIYVKTERAGQRVMESVKRFLTKKLKLKVNEKKSAVGKPQERKFLGFSYTWGKELKRRIAPAALKRFKTKVRELTGKSRSIHQTVKNLAKYLTGWRGYFGFSQTPSVIQSLESWIRRRLRSIIWRQGKRGKTRYKELRQRGIPHFQAAVAAGAPTGPWGMARHATVQQAFPNAYFDSLGLPRLVVRTA